MRRNYTYFRITENTSQGKEGERSNKSSPVHDRKPIHVEISKPFHNPETGPAKNSLHIEVNLPLPPAASGQTKLTSVSPGPEAVTEATGKILQLGSEAGAGGKPCVVIPPPPKEINNFTFNEKDLPKCKIFLQTLFNIYIIQCEIGCLQIEPPPPPADFVPLQHSASAPNFNNRAGV